MFIFGKEKKVDKVNEEIERLKQQKTAIQQEINALKQERSDVTKEIETSRETLAGIENEIANGRQTQYTIDGMEEYGIPYYGDSLDELEHRRFELQQELMLCCGVGALEGHQQIYPQRLLSAGTGITEHIWRWRNVCLQCLH